MHEKLAYQSRIYRSTPLTDTFFASFADDLLLVERWQKKMKQKYNEHNGHVMVVVIGI